MITIINPLLSASGAPDFAAVRPEHISPAIEALIERCDQALARITAPGVEPRYKSVSMALDVPVQELQMAWGIVSHLHGVVATPELRAVYAQALPKVTAMFTRFATNEGLYALDKRILSEDGSLSDEERESLKKALTGLVLSGAELQGAEKERFAETSQRMATLGREFSTRLMDATDGFVYWASEAELAGVPDDVVAALRQAGAAEGKDRLKVTLHAPSLGPVMQYAHDRALREMLYQANATRASEFGPAELNNDAVIAEIMALRQERAALLGYSHFAAVSLVPKMAGSSDQVQTFLRDLAARSRPAAGRELAELRVFAAEELGIHSLQAWDVAYASEQLRSRRYAFSEQDVKVHFQMERVLSGMFDIAQDLFGIRIQPEYMPAWHETVRTYRVERDGVLVGHFYFDPFARQGKQGGAWMNGAQPRWTRPDGVERLPLAYLITNFGRPAEGRPALLSHREVVTLFHEFGHGLHFLLTQVRTLGVSGISGVEWDAVELPSQLMENFAWEWPVLQKLTAHVDSGEPLPRDLYDKMVAARNFQGGLALVRQVELSLFDMRLHAEQIQNAQALMEEVRSEVSVITPPSYLRFQNGFSHIFAGGYAAGYYSYLWAEVLAADAWGEFERLGPLQAATGQKYLDAILGRGGSRPMDVNFREFVGREPRLESLLKQRGLAVAA